MSVKGAAGLLCVGCASLWAASWGLSGGFEGTLPAKAAASRVSTVRAAGPAPAPLRYLGTSTCASMACHNGQAPPGTPGSEYGAWAAQPADAGPCDKHGRAFEVLFEERSRLMARRLGRGKPAHEDSLCLNCHVVPNHDSLMERGLLPRSFASDGVGCESCHGPAEKWLTEHYKPAWRTTASAVKQSLGMTDTRPIANRARLCAQCHIGSLPAEKGGLGQDVYHDIYAAGHPPLVFEFGAYHATTLHHWPDALDKDPRWGGVRDFEARAWLVGQVVSAEAALELLAWRAQDEARPWPEFAEMDCFACHHDLKGRSPRQEPGSTRRPGSIPMRSWHYAMLPRALEAIEKGGSADVAALLAALRKQMEAARPSRAVAAKHARALRDRLGPWLEKAGSAPLDLDALRQAIRSQDVPRVRDSWDEAAQVFLAVAALENTWNDLQISATHGNLPSTLEAIRRELRFPRGFLSPVRFDGPSVLRLMEKLR